MPKRDSYIPDRRPLPYEVRPIAFPAVRDFITKHHYAHGMTNNTSGAFGLFEKEQLIGALSFSTPCSENVRASVFGAHHKAHVTELSRLVILDVTPRNAESYFISRCLDSLKKTRPDIWAVVTFSDPSAGHVGTIYRASNAIYYGRSEPRVFYLDPHGRLRHRRQCGVNITRSMARDLGWTPTLRAGKYRYCFKLHNAPGAHSPPVQLTARPYPEAETTMNGLDFG